jgi:Chromatin remodeling protein, contains PhD zinc finger
MPTVPDSVKITSKRVRSLLNLIEVDSDGLVPHPVKICHSCGRTCFRTGPLLGCDYCPLYYHLDCLDPPLASPPTLTWMCPAHPQHIVDQMLTQGGVVERSEAWDAWALRSVNEEQVRDLCNVSI